MRIFSFSLWYKLYIIWFWNVACHLMPQETWFFWDQISNPFIEKITVRCSLSEMFYYKSPFRKSVNKYNHFITFSRHIDVAILHVNGPWNYICFRPTNSGADFWVVSYEISFKAPCVSALFKCLTPWNCFPFVECFSVLFVYFNMLTHLQ